MSVSPDIQRAIRAIDKKIEALEEMKQRLIAEFGGGPIQENRPISVHRTVRVRDVARDAQLRIPAIPVAGHGSTQIERFETFLQEHGPATSAQISEGANIPRGSISWLMRRSGGRIRRREDGLIELAS